jgi:hypothetical protein
MPTWERYIKKLLFETQKGICPICEKWLKEDPNSFASNIVIEHNHISGEIRGLTHRSCNLKIAQIETHTKKFNYIISIKEKEKIKVYLQNHLKLRII